jgi:hypothetical protein
MNVIYNMSIDRADKPWIGDRRLTEDLSGFAEPPSLGSYADSIPSRAGSGASRPCPGGHYDHHCPTGDLQLYCMAVWWGLPGTMRACEGLKALKAGHPASGIRHPASV